MEIIGGKGGLQEMPGGAALLAAGVQHRPDAAVPLSAPHRTAPLGDAPINDQLTHALFAPIVGRRDRGVEQEAEDRIAMFTQTFSQRRRLGRQVILFGQSQHSFFDSQHATMKLTFGLSQDFFQFFESWAIFSANLLFSWISSATCFSSSAIRR